MIGKHEADDLIAATARDARIFRAALKDSARVYAGSTEEELATLRAPWVMVNVKVDPPVFQCGRCGGEERIAIPLKASDFIEQGDHFMGQHEKCEERQ